MSQENVEIVRRVYDAYLPLHPPERHQSGRSSRGTVTKRSKRAISVTRPPAKYSPGNVAGERRIDSARH
jgi:hypothetical protein